MPISVTKSEVIKHAEEIINKGRKSKIEISKHSQPYNIIENLTQEDCNRMDEIGRYKGISANDYDTKASLLWTSLFWKIGEQILMVSNYQSQFTQFYKEISVGADIEEVAPRIKDGLDRMTLSNSALLSNYVTQYDSFYYRINNFKVFASTYDKTEIQRISNSWDNVTTMINSELANILLSVNTYIHELSKHAFTTQYLSGGMDAIVLPKIIDNETAIKSAVLMNNAMSAMKVEPNQLYIPFNKNSLNPDKTIKDVASSNLCLTATSGLLNDVHFRTALSTYFGKEWENSKFANKVIEVTKWADTISPEINMIPGYTAVGGTPKILGFIFEENACVMRQNLIGTMEFNNQATLKTTIFQHLDAMANISSRRKVVALIEGN